MIHANNVTNFMTSSFQTTIDEYLLALTCLKILFFEVFFRNLNAFIGLFDCNWGFAIVAIQEPRTFIGAILLKYIVL